MGRLRSLCVGPTVIIRLSQFNLTKFVRQLELSLEIRNNDFYFSLLLQRLGLKRCLGKKIDSKKSASENKFVSKQIFGPKKNCPKIRGHDLKGVRSQLSCQFFLFFIELLDFQYFGS